MQALRVALSTLEVAFFYWAVTYLPLAETVTFYHRRSDLCGAAGTARFLGEQISHAAAGSPSPSVLSAW
jgi:hypothetical protein